MAGQTSRRSARITDVTRDKIGADLKKKYEKGASIRALAAGIGRSYGFVHRLLSAQKVVMRPRGGNYETRPPGPALPQQGTAPTAQPRP
jgi:hypothetical protein